MELKKYELFKISDEQIEFFAYNQFVKNIIFLILTGLLTIHLNGCSSLTRNETATQFAIQNQFIKKEIPTPTFRLTSFEKIQSSTPTATIYIEGDGLAWKNKYTPSNDPTPIKPMALLLASEDPSANVIALARPCQYTTMTHSSDCPQKYWTSHRFSNEVIEAFDLALDKLKHQHGFQNFHLVGFSGGAAVAILIAEHRNDILSLRTVAGNLDHTLVNDFHQVTPLTDSLNPIDSAKAIAHIPQHHFLGKKDNVIPQTMLHHFYTESMASPCFKYSFIDQASHEKGWIEIWNDLLNKPLGCQ